MLIPSVAVSQAHRVRTLTRRRLAALFEEVDVLAWPTVPAPAPPLASPVVELPSGPETADQANVRGGALANLTGTPAINAPGRAQLRRAADRPPARGGLGAGRAPARRRRGSRARQRAPVGRGPRRRSRSRLRLDAGSRRRDRRAGPARQLARGRSRRDALRVHPAEPDPLPVAVVLGLLLRGDRLAPLRPGPLAAELESLLAAQRDDGFIGHTIFWDRPVSLGRLPFYNVASRRSFQTETIQPPLLAWAWRIAVGDPAAEPRIAAQVEWLARNRDLEGDGLLWIVQPDESGLDASPKFEEVWGRRANGADRLPLPRPPQPPPRLRRARGSATPAARCSARSWSTPSGRSRCRRSAGPRRRRR